MSEKAQQEMVGFVLIVVLVVVALMILLIVSIRSTATESFNNQEADHMVSALLKQTTTCATQFTSKQDTVRDLIKSCYNGLDCKNRDESACAHLNQTIKKTIQAMLDTTTYHNYQFSIFEEDTTGKKGFFQASNGNCSSQIQAAQKNLAQGRGSLITRLIIC